MKTAVKRLWYLARGDLSRSGATETVHPRSDVKEFRELGWEAILHASSYGQSEAQANEVILTRKRTWMERLIFEFRMCKRLLFSREKPSVLFVRAPTNLVFACLTAKLTGVKLVVELNGLFPYVWEGVRFSNAPAAFADRTILRIADLIVSVTPELKDYAMQRCGRATRHVIAPNGVDLDFDQSDLPRRTEPTERSSFQLGFIGRLYEFRALVTLIDVIARLNQDFDAQLVVAGDGPWQTKMEERARQLGVQDKVRFLGEVPHNDLPQHFVGCDLMWSMFEEFPRFDITGMTPLKIWTYLAMGKPVLARSGSYLKRYESVPGMFWTPSASVEDIVDAINKFRESDPGHLEAMVVAGQRYVAENATWRKHVELIDSAIEPLLH